MAKPISSTPPVKGRDAERIQREMRLGTPDTPQRVQTIREADAIYRRIQERNLADRG